MNEYITGMNIIELIFYEVIIMLIKEFYDEVKSSDICPKDFDDVYKEFNHYQQLSLDTLRAFHIVCEKAGIKYQLEFGSLLGAIRDHGQIPWDYDVDVIIPFSERYALIDALKSDLPDDYYFYCPENNEECKYYFMRVSPKGYRSDKIHVDVFYVIGAPASIEDRLAFETKMYKYFNMRRDKLSRLNDYPQNAYKGKLGCIVRRAKNAFVSLSKINDELENICNQYDPEETDITIPVFSAYKHIYWITSELWETELLDTDFGTFRITKHYDKILRNIYKDYNRIFPLQNRIDELYTNYYLIKHNKRLISKHSVFRYYMNN